MTPLELVLITMILSVGGHLLYQRFSEVLSFKEKKLDLELNLQGTRLEFEEKMRMLQLGFKELEEELSKVKIPEEIEAQLKARLEENILLAKEMSDLKDRYGEQKLSEQQIEESFGFPRSALR